MTSVMLPDAGYLLLLSSVRRDRRAVRRIFGDHRNRRFRLANSCVAGLPMIRSGDVAVVVCGRELPDGDWRMVIDEAGKLPVSPKVIVCTARVDAQFWAEVLNLGGFDVLLTPFEEDELLRVSAGAWMEWQRAQPCGLPPRKPVKRAGGMSIAVKSQFALASGL